MNKYAEDLYMAGQIIAEGFMDKLASGEENFIDEDYEVEKLANELANTYSEDELLYLLEKTADRQDIVNWINSHILRKPSIPQGFAFAGPKVRTSMFKSHPEFFMSIPMFDFRPSAPALPPHVPKPRVTKKKISKMPEATKSFKWSKGKGIGIGLGAITAALIASRLYKNKQSKQGQEHK